MKKIINDPKCVVSDMLQGFAKANPNVVYLGEGVEVIARKHKKRNKVGVITGGGSGHEPAHAGYVGYGMLDAAVAGHVFTSPSPDRIIAGIRAADSGAGVLMIIKNYSGDIMNFSLSGDIVAAEGIKTDYVVVRDDVAVEESTYSTGRRGIAGTVFVHKIAGAAAENGKSLAEVKRIAQKTIDYVRTMGMAMTPCILPSVGKPGFTLGEDEVEIGMGIHGEPGISREQISSAAATARKLLGKIFADTSIYENNEVALMVNGLGGTPLMELYILNNEVQKILEEKNIRVYKTFVGNYMTSLEMSGASISLLKLDDELKFYLDYPSGAPSMLVESDMIKEETENQIVQTGSINIVSIDEETTVIQEFPDEVDTPFRLLSDDYVNYINIIANRIRENADYITAIDAATGDGDHWTNINLGFEQMVKAGNEMRHMKICDVFRKIGAIMMTEVAGSSGILYGGAFINAAKSCSGRNDLTSIGLCNALEAMMNDIMVRGKAEPGMKTMVDALYPAVMAYKRGIADGANINTILKDVKQAAIDGAESTRNMEAVKGRATYQKNKGVGHLDPGAVTMSYQIECLCDYIMMHCLKTCY